MNELVLILADLPFGNPTRCHSPERTRKQWMSVGLLEWIRKLLQFDGSARFAFLNLFVPQLFGLLQFLPWSSNLVQFGIN